MKNKQTQKLIESGLLIALATILSFIKVFELIYGGSITAVSMLPIALLAYRYGVKWGLLSGFAYGVLQLTIGSFGSAFKGLTPAAVIAVILIDYILAFSALGLGGIMKGKLKKGGVGLALAVLIGGIARYVMHIISGYFVFGDYAEWFFTDVMKGTNITDTFSGNALSFVYSVVYNGLYMIPEIIVTIIAGVIVGILLPRLHRINE